MAFLYINIEYFTFLLILTIVEKMVYKDRLTLNLNNVYLFSVAMYQITTDYNMFVILWFPWDRSSGTS